MKLKDKIIAIILCVLMLSNMMPAITVSAAGLTESWQDSGIPDTQWHIEQTAAGQGSSGNPYVIGTAAELAGLASLVNGGNPFANQYIKLSADIDLAGKEWVPIGTNSNRFYGIFDGDGHIVSNLTMYVESDNCAGLFGYMGLYLGTCGIRNLGVVNVNIGGEIRNGAALAASVSIDGDWKNAVFENCFATGNISSDYLHACLGGLFSDITSANANNSSMTVRNCYSACNISVTNTDNQIYYTRYVGGMIGGLNRYHGNLTFTNNYSASKVCTANPNRTRIGGFAGYANTTNQIVMTNCLFDTQAAGIDYGFGSAGVSFSGVVGRRTSAMTGTSALPAGWNGTSVWQAETDLYPQLRVFNGNDSSLASAIPFLLFENATVPEFSDTMVNVRHNFTVPDIAGMSWSTDPSGILDFSGGQATFASPASDTEVTVTATLASGAKKEFVILCKSGVDPGDATPPEITIGEITPSDFSASIPVTSGEAADMYVLVKLSSVPAPGAGSIIADGGTVKGSGTAFPASVGSLQHSSDYIAYVVGIDATGNASSVVSEAFTTLPDQTPPAWSGNTPVSLSGGTASFQCAFNETGTFKYAVLPAAQTAPSKTQAAAGQDASGNPAYYFGQHADVPAGSSPTVTFDISGFAPDPYKVYLVCVDASGNISNVLTLSFEIIGNVNFTVTDGTDPVEGAEVTAGTETNITDANGQAVFTLSGGSYIYSVIADGYCDASGSFEMDAQEKSIPVTLAVLTPPSISPTSVNYDLSDPADVTTVITWNSALTVTDVVYGEDHLITIPGAFTVNDNILAIKDGYLSGLTLSKGDALEFTINFNTGATASLMMNVVDNYIPSNDAALNDLTVGGSTVSGFAADQYEYDVELPYGTLPGSAAATVSATANDELYAQVNITQVSDIPGYATVVVTAEDKTTTKIYTINFTLAAPTAYSITVQNDGHGTGSANPTPAAQGTTITLSSSPNSGYHFKEWQAISPVSLSIAGNTFTMPDEAVTVRAVFEADAVTTYTVTFNSDGSVYTTKTVQAGASIGSADWPANPAKSGYTFGGWFTGANGSGNVFTSATPVNAAITVYAKWTSNGGGGSEDRGSGGGGSSTPTNNTPAVPTPSETPKTEIITSGNTSTATMTTTATVDSSGKAAAAVTQTQISDAVSKAVEEAAKHGDGTVAVVEIKVEAPATATAVETSLPKAAMDAIAGSNANALTISTPIAAITFDAEALDTIAGAAAADVKISAAKVDAETLSDETKQVVGDHPVYNFSVTSGDKTISQFGGNVSVSVPYTPKPGEDTNAIVIYYINAEGKPEIVSNCAYDPATGTISFTTNHFSKYAVGYNKVRFKDVAASAWYKKAVGFIAARGITAGTGNGDYSPEAKLTRAEFLVMMMRAYGISPDANPAENFADAGSTYYTGYLAAAKRLGISGGVGGNLFAPGKEITRQEMFTLLYNALKGIGGLPAGKSGKQLSGFSDAGKIAVWAKDAMTLFVESGTISGNGGKLFATSTTTRAEMAQVQYNLLAK